MSGGTPWLWGPIALSRSRSRPRLWSRWSPRSSGRKKAARRKAADPTMPVRHDSLREGARLGFIVATSIWIWLAVVDAVVGQPFRTFTVLGGLGCAMSCGRLRKKRMNELRSRVRAGGAYASRLGGCGLLRGDEARHLSQRPEVVYLELLERHADGELLLERGEQLDEHEGVHDAGGE